MDIHALSSDGARLEREPKLHHNTHQIAQEISSLSHFH